MNFLLYTPRRYGKPKQVEEVVSLDKFVTNSCNEMLDFRVHQMYMYFYMEK